MTKMAFFGRYEIEITITPLGGLLIKCSFHFQTYIIATRPRPVLNKLSDRLFIFRRICQDIGKI